MWLLLRSQSTKSAIFIDHHSRIWQNGNDRRVTIDQSEGQLILDFNRVADAKFASDLILNSLASGVEALDSVEAGWAEFSPDWIWFQPHGAPHFPDRPEDDDEELDTEPYDWKIDLVEEWGYTPPDDPELRKLWEGWRNRDWTSRQFRDADTFILTACVNRYLSMLEIASLIGRSPDGIRVHHVNPLVHAGKLIKEFPGRRHPKQRYTTNVEEFQPEAITSERPVAGRGKRLVR